MALPTRVAIGRAASTGLFSSQFEPMKNPPTTIPTMDRVKGMTTWRVMTTTSWETKPATTAKKPAPRLTMAKVVLIHSAGKSKATMCSWLYHCWKGALTKAAKKPSPSRPMRSRGSEGKNFKAHEREPTRRARRHRARRPRGRVLAVKERGLP